MKGNRRTCFDRCGGFAFVCYSSAIGLSSFPATWNLKLSKEAYGSISKSVSTLIRIYFSDLFKTFIHLEVNPFSNISLTLSIVLYEPTHKPDIGKQRTLSALTLIKALVRRSHFLFLTMQNFDGSTISVVSFLYKIEAGTFPFFKSLFNNNILSVIFHPYIAKVFCCNSYLYR